MREGNVGKYDRVEYWKIFKFDHCDVVLNLGNDVFSTGAFFVGMQFRGFRLANAMLVFSSYQTTYNLLYEANLFRGKFKSRELAD